MNNLGNDPETSSGWKLTEKNNTREAILATLAFFSLYDLPISAINVHQLLYKTYASFDEVKTALDELVREGRITFKNGLYALNEIDEKKLGANKFELDKRWEKVYSYYGLLSLIPFVHQLSIINSLAVGNAHQESDIDFFVVTKPNRLYFVRSIIIVLFRLLGVYKTRQQINERFCFGFYIDSDHLSLEKVLLDGEDPHFAFWFASFAPLLNKSGFLHLVQANPWIYKYFPNFDPYLCLSHLQPKRFFIRSFKGILEIILTLPAIVLEPFLRQIHIKHTFDLPENHWATSTTVADKSMLKLHALDPRKDIRQRFLDLLQKI